MPQKGAFSLSDIDQPAASGRGAFSLSDINIGNDNSVLYDPNRRPASAEDFMRPEDIANRDNGTSIAGDLLRGFGKRAVNSVVGMGEMASTNVAESAARAAANVAGAVTGRASPFNPVIRDPALLRVDEALTPKNDAEKVGGYMELAAEVGAPAVSAIRAAPSLARAAISAVKSVPKNVVEPLARAAMSDASLLTQARQMAAKKILGHVLESTATKAPAAAEEAAQAAPAVMSGTSTAPPQVISAPGGFSMPAAAPPRPVVAPPGRVVVPVPKPSVEEALAGVIEQARQPTPPALVTTPPPAELPPGYTPRSTVPKPAVPKVVRERMAARQAKMAGPAAPVAEPAAPPKRAYFLRSPEDIAAASAPAEAVQPTGSITIDDLPEAWKSRTGQDLFPTTGAQAKEITAALRQEIKDRGMTIGQAIAAVSKNRNISTELRYQIQRSLAGSAKAGGK